MKINDEGTSNAAHWHERAMKAEARLAEAEALLLWIREHAGPYQPIIDCIDAFLSAADQPSPLTCDICGATDHLEMHCGMRADSASESHNG